MKHLLAFVLLSIAGFAVLVPGITTGPAFDQTLYLVERQEWPTYADGLQRVDYLLSRRY